MTRSTLNGRRRRERRVAIPAALALGALGAWACSKAEVTRSEALASGQAPAELKLCPPQASDAGDCPAACGDLQGVGLSAGADAGSPAVQALVELPDEQVLFTASGASVYQGGVSAIDVAASVQWTGAAALPAADGTGTWAVGIDSDGQLWRVTGAGTLEAISDRFGLAKDKVLAAAAAGGQSAGFALESGLAVSDGTALQRYDAHPTSLSGGPGALAWVESGVVNKLAVGTGALTRWPLSGASGAALAQDGTVAAITAHELWTGAPGGDITLAYRTTAALGSLTASENRFWFFQAGELGYLEGDAGAHTATAIAAADAALAPAVGGGVWSLSGGVPQKWTVGSGELAVWQQRVQPVFARVCASCHGAGGGALGLASLQAWEDNRAAIRAQVLEGGDGGSAAMPPAASTQPTADELHQLQCWLDDAP